MLLDRAVELLDELAKRVRQTAGEDDDGRAGGRLANVAMLGPAFLADANQRRVGAGPLVRLRAGLARVGGAR